MRYIFNMSGDLDFPVLSAFASALEAMQKAGTTSCIVRSGVSTGRLFMLRKTKLGYSFTEDIFIMRYVQSLERQV